MFLQWKNEIKSNKLSKVIRYPEHSSLESSETKERQSTGREGGEEETPRDIDICYPARAWKAEDIQKAMSGVRGGRRNTGSEKEEET